MNRVWSAVQENDEANLMEPVVYKENTANSIEELPTNRSVGTTIQFIFQLKKHPSTLPKKTLSKLRHVFENPKDTNLTLNLMTLL